MSDRVDAAREKVVLAMHKYTRAWSDWANLRQGQGLSSRKKQLVSRNRAYEAFAIALSEFEEAVAAKEHNEGGGM